MTPTTNINKLVAASGGTLSNVFGALEDSKVSFPEILGMFGSLTQFAGIDYAAASSEWKGADAEAKALIRETVANSVTLKDKPTELKVEAVINMMVESGALFQHNVAVAA